MGEAPASEEAVVHEMSAAVGRVRHADDGHAGRRAKGASRMTRYLLLLHVDESGWPRLSPAEQAAAMGRYEAFNQALGDARVLVANGRLASSALARGVRTVGGKTVAMDGPFAETKEQVAGFYLIEAPDIAAAQDWAAKCPAAQHGAVEVREIWPTPAPAAA